MMKYLNPRNRAILREMVSTDFKVRYQNSVLGYLWSLLKPLFLFAILYVVFTYIIPLGKDVEHFPVYLLTGIVLWNFFTEATMLGASSVVSRSDLIRKISIPRYLVVLSSSVSALINLGISLVVVLLFALLNGVAPRWEWILVFLVIFELFVFSLGIAFLLATAFVKYRDITYVWEIILQAGFYASAIIFPLTMVPSELHKWFFLNPIVQIIQDARFLIIGSEDIVTIWGAVSVLGVMIPFLVIMAFCLWGVLYFKRRSKYFAEDI